ncbi:GerMN domain-containing protein [Thermotalea metallivorans]|uniref:GerMN domain-containing protein n=1 Tax=Thermotalea metallivorans TaxID=520762 RepID=A0A140L1G7_9FIRM|nr:GerMN domain-containing protein [Thermotalea metallivorans]KXG74392.1 hypothetical protein AN619_23750 [Thermotalea metallivorans]
MKKRMLVLLWILLIVGLWAAGCTKADKGQKTQNNNPPPSNQEATETTEGEKEKEIDYVLYLRHKEKPFLMDEAYSISTADDRLKDLSFEEFIVKELINFQGFGEYINPIPKGTRLLSLEKKEKQVVVNLSKEFVKGQKGTSNDTLLTLATIINSLTVLPDVEEVQFMIESKIVENVNGIDISKPFAYIQGLYPDK